MEMIIAPGPAPFCLPMTFDFQVTGAAMHFHLDSQGYIRTYVGHECEKDKAHDY